MTKKASKNALISKEYIKTLSDIKKQIKKAQVKATLAANKELLKLYWSIGKIINERQSEYGWGSKFIEDISKDLQSSFPGTGGFSRANLFYIKAFYNTYKIVQQAAGQIDKFPIFNIPWFHNVILITKLKNNKERLWYA